jgi:hypothetical protein
LPALRDALRSPAVFNPFFAWAYEFSCESGQKSITLDIAIGLSQMLLSPDRWPLAETWVDFLKSQSKTVSKDTWRQLLTYMTTVKPDLSNHDDNSASLLFPRGLRGWYRLRLPTPPFLFPAPLLLHPGLGMYGPPLPPSLCSPNFTSLLCAGAWPSMLDDFRDFVVKRGGAATVAARAGAGR